MAQSIGAEPRYRAFISYNHEDSVFGRRLHRQLEAYTIPRRLAGRMGRAGPIPSRLSPIFRDREELSAANDLSLEVRAALDDARCLIVVCSPAAARSRWVAHEIEIFRGLHPDRPIFAALIAGEPVESLPPPLIAEGREPLAADFRKGGDGFRLALLKLIAGLTGAELDQLIQRDAQRRLTSVMAITVAAFATTLTMAAMTVVALDARREAERQRVEAEALVDFMLSDLRTELKKMGRLSALDGVDRRAFDYYSRQDLSRLKPASLEQRARILHALGEDDEARGEFAQALEKFEAARQTTAVLLQKDPNNPDRLWAHAQSEFWIGTVAYARGHRPLAFIKFQAYRNLADRMIAVRPGTPVMLRELGYAEGNICSLEIINDPHNALQACQRALTHMEAAARTSSHPQDYAADIANRHAWLADAYRELGDLKSARSERIKQQTLLEASIARDPSDMELKLNWAALQRAFGALDIAEGRYAAARARLLSARSTLRSMTRADPSNALWRSRLQQINAALAYVDNQRN